MLIDQFMPDWDFDEYHQRRVAAPAGLAFGAMLDIDMAKSPIIMALLRLRELPTRLGKAKPADKGPSFTMNDMAAAGFIRLGQDPDHEMVMGLAGRFWSPVPHIEPLTPEEFAGFDRPGYAKLTTNLWVRPLDQGASLLGTETRVQCFSPKAKRRFRRYWRLIRPFSGLIRLEWLRLAKNQAEGQVAAGPV